MQVKIFSRNSSESDVSFETRINNFLAEIAEDRVIQFKESFGRHGTMWSQNITIVYKDAV